MRLGKRAPVHRFRWPGLFLFKIIEKDLLMEFLNENLGKMLGAKEVAEYLGFDIKTVRKLYKELGGVQLGRRYVFFERRIIDAVQKRTEMGGSGEDRRKESSSEDVYKKKGRESVGGASSKRICRRPSRDAGKYDLSSGLGK